MRYFPKITTLILILILCFAVPVFANILSDVASGATNWVIENALASLISIVFMLIGAFFGKTVWGKLAIKAKVPIIELKDVVIKVHQARLGNSPGGTKITDTEKDDILKEVEEVVAAVIAVFGEKASIV